MPYRQLPIFLRSSVSSLVLLDLVRPVPAPENELAPLLPVVLRPNSVSFVLKSTVGNWSRGAQAMRVGRFSFSGFYLNRDCFVCDSITRRSPLIRAKFQILRFAPAIRSVIASAYLFNSAYSLFPVYPERFPQAWFFVFLPGNYGGLQTRGHGCYVSVATGVFFPLFVVRL